MSKFINTEHKMTIDALIDNVKDKLNNPYYLFTDKKACPVEYYNLNVTKSTLDEGTRTPYDLVGNKSPLKFNLIHDALLYGIDRIAITTDMGEYGQEADPIEGEAIVLPNTFIPYENDYFKIQHVDQNIIFKVISVSPDTLESGANIYKLTYKLDLYNDDRLDNQVETEYRMIVNNVGTNYNSVIRSNDYDLIEKYDTLCTTLKNYYKNLFYDNKVQTFIFNMDNTKFYDPYMIEFLIRNKIMEDSGEFLYVGHAAETPKSFPVDYNRSFFRSIEIGDKNNISDKIISVAFGIEDMNSFMSPYVRPEYYFMIDYMKVDGLQFNGKIENFHQDIIDRIQRNDKYTEKKDLIWNPLIDYFNKTPLGSKTLEVIDSVDYNFTKDVFYGLPILIYVIEQYIKTLLK